MKTLFVALMLCLRVSSAQYSLNVEQIGGATRGGENNLSRIQLIHNGTAVRTIERRIPFDVPFPAATINESTGIFVLSYIMDGFAEVYDNTGAKVWEQNFFKEMGPNYERTITVALGTSSIIFATSDVRLPNAVVRKYSMSGAKMWETQLPYAMGNDVAMSPDEQTIVAGSYHYSNGSVSRSTSILSSSGAMAGTADILFNRAAFSEDRRLFALSNNTTVMTISSETKKEIGRITTAGDGLITGLLWSGDSLVVQTSLLQTMPEGSFTYHNPTFVLYTSSLHELQQETVASVPFKTSSLKMTGSGIIFNDGSTSVKIFSKQ